MKIAIKLSTSEVHYYSYSDFFIFDLLYPVSQIQVLNFQRLKMIDIKELLQQYKTSYQSLTFCETFCIEVAKKYSVNDDRYVNKLKRLVELCIIIQMLPLQSDRDTEFKIINEEG